MGQALSRSEAREVAFRVIFAGEDLDTVWELALGEKTAPAPERQFIERVVNAAREHLSAIDEKINAHLQGWTMDRLRRTDLAALRLAVAEMQLNEVPVPVIINEAVNLAKKYGDQQSGTFVNGILNQIAG